MQSKEVQLLDHFNNRSSGYQSAPKVDPTRANLLNTRTKHPVFADLGTTSWGDVDDPELEEVKSMPIPQLKQEQQVMLQGINFSHKFFKCCFKKFIFNFSPG